MSRTPGGKKGHNGNKKVRHNLEGRQASFDAMPSDKKKGATRPGSTNSHKQG